MHIQISSSNSDLFELGILLLGLGAYGFYTGFKILRHRRLIENTPRSKIASMPLGLVEVHGKADAIYQLTAPLTQRPCVYFEILVEEYRGGKRKSWRKVFSTNSAAVDFLVKDETGMVTVQPQNAIFYFTKDDKITFQNSLFASLSTDANQYLSSKGLAVTSFLGTNRNFKITETVLPFQQDIFVLGDFTQKVSDPQSRQQELLIQKLRELRKSPEIIKKYDTNKDGKLDAEEWETVRKTIESEIVQKSDLENKKLVIRSCRNHPFIISRMSEKELQSHMSLKVLLGIYGGPIAFISGFIMIYLKLNS